MSSLAFLIPSCETVRAMWEPSHAVRCIARNKGFLLTVMGSKCEITTSDDSRDEVRNKTTFDTCAREEHDRSQISCDQQSLKASFCSSYALSSSLLVANSASQTRSCETPLSGPHHHTTQNFCKLQQLLASNQAALGVIGLGYVGLPLAITFSQTFSVFAYDIDASKILSLRNGKSYIHSIPSSSIPASTCLVTTDRSQKLFTATNDLKDLAICDVFILCLPTPVDNANQPDMKTVFDTVDAIAGIMRRGALVVLESTVYPGATDGQIYRIIKKRLTEREIKELNLRSDTIETSWSSNRNGEKLTNPLEEANYECCSPNVNDDDFFLVYSPERENPGSELCSREIPKLIAGVTSDGTNLGCLLYQQGHFDRVIPTPNTKIAECAKLVENIYRAINIALVNELKHVFRKMDINIWDVLAAAETKPFGFHRFNPGPGIGGHCIPIDPFYLTYKARTLGLECRLIEAAAKINCETPERVVDVVIEEMNKRRWTIRGRTLLLMGVAYKEDVDDLREAPALEIWSVLEKQWGLRVEFCDPLVPEIGQLRKYDWLNGRRSWGLDVGEQANAEETTPQFARKRDEVDVVVVVTNHKVFGRFEMLDGFKGIVIDTRNCVPDTINVYKVMA